MRRRRGREDRSQPEYLLELVVGQEAAGSADAGAGEAEVGAGEGSAAAAGWVAGAGLAAAAGPRNESTRDSVADLDLATSPSSSRAIGTLCL